MLTFAGVPISVGLEVALQAVAPGRKFAVVPLTGEAGLKIGQTGRARESAGFESRA